MGYIYKITNDINNKVYIGKTEFDVQKRFQEHIKDSKKNSKNRPLYKAMNKYGVQHFSIEIIEECDNLEQREKYWIKYYDSYKNGYNATLGGDGKAYIDYDLILRLFAEGYNVIEIANKTKHDCKHISQILREKGSISAQQIHDRRMKNLEKEVVMVDSKTKKEIKHFKSIAEAGRYCINNNLSKDTVDGVSSHISQCCRGKRKTAYQHCWFFV